MIDSTSAFPARVRRRWAGNAVRGRILVPVLPFVLTVATAAASPNAAVPCGTFVANWIRPADGTSPPGFSPYGVAVDRRGDVYVADDATSRIEKFQRDGTFLPTWGAQGNAAAGFHEPQGIAVDRRGNVYAIDVVVILGDRLLGGRAIRFDRDGGLVRAWGDADEPSRFVGPNSVAVDGDGKVYVSDSFGHRIEQFRGSGAFLRMWGTYGTGDGQLDHPLGIAVGRRGAVYVADVGNGRVVQFDSRGRFVRAWTTAGAGGEMFDSPAGIAVDRRGNVYVTDRIANRVAKFDRKGRFVAGWGSSGSGDGQLNVPAGIAVDRNGNVFVGDLYNQRLVKFACP